MTGRKDSASGRSPLAAQRTPGGGESQEELEYQEEHQQLYKVLLEWNLATKKVYSFGDNHVE